MLLAFGKSGSAGFVEVQCFDKINLERCSCWSVSLLPVHVQHRSRLRKRVLSGDSYGCKRASERNTFCAHGVFSNVCKTTYSFR